MEKNVLDIFLQILITIFGILAIFLLSLKHKARRYGFVAGLVSDMFWILWVLLTHNYIFLIFTAARMLCYLNGMKNYFWKKQSWNHCYPHSEIKGKYDTYIANKENLRDSYTGEYYEIKKIN